MTENFVMIICIELDVLTWLISNQPLYWSSRIPEILSQKNWRDVVNISKCVRVPEYDAEGFY